MHPLLMRPDLICLQNTFSLIWQSSSTLLDMDRSRVFPRPICPPPQVQGDKVLMGGLMRGDIDLMGGPNFDRLYYKLKVLLLLSCNYMMQFVGYGSIKTR